MSVGEEQPDQALCPSPDVMFREVGGEAVLLDLREGRYYGLDEVGSRVWQLIVRREGREAIVRQLLSEYEVDERTLREDVESLVEELRGAGLAASEAGFPGSGPAESRPRER